MRNVRMASEKQVDFIRGLLAERDLMKSPKFFDSVQAMDNEELDNYIMRLQESADELTMQQASAWIAKLLELPKKQKVFNKTQPVDIVKGRTRVEWEIITGDDGKERKVGKIILPDGR